MKWKSIALIALAAALLGGGWFARAAWRAHRGLITLHVRNAPLADVVRSIERQSWQTICANQKLKARITLDVDSAPLDQVLDLVSARAGARWGKTYAVYAADSAQAAIENVLRGGATLAGAGFTNIAPKADPEAMEQMSGLVNGQPQAHSGPMVMKQNGAMKMFTISSSGAVEQWSSERIVMQASLAAQLSDPPADANPESAARAAAAVHGRSRLYYALERSPVAMAGGGGGMRSMSWNSSGPRGGHGDPGHPPSMSEIMANISQAQRAGRLRELSYSPEEQVERARQNATGKTQVRFESNETTK